MSLGIDGLHKILKDENRRQIILSLSQKGSLSYSDLMNTLGFGSTGTLNYHLKVLGDLLTKNASGRYILSEKGLLAAKILTEFPDSSSQLQKQKRQKRFWTASALSQIIYLVIVLTLYSYGYLDFGRLILYTMAFFGSIIVAYLGYRMQKHTPIAGSDVEKSRLKKAYIMSGGLAGLVIAFFGTAFLTFISVRLGGPNFMRILNEPWEVLVLASVLVVLGSVAGYFAGKRNNFEEPKWITKIDEKFGF